MSLSQSSGGAGVSTQTLGAIDAEDETGPHQTARRRLAMALAEGRNGRKLTLIIDPGSSSRSIHMPS
jgi:hypothetical protein